jgi:hypothetical protein
MVFADDHAEMFACEADLQGACASSGAYDASRQTLLASGILLSPNLSLLLRARERCAQAAVGAKSTNAANSLKETGWGGSGR